jgi:hypothetical protein
MASILNRTHTKEFALVCAKKFRPAAPFKTVSKDFLDRAESQLRVWIAHEVARHPTIGKTIK